MIRKFATLSGLAGILLGPFSLSGPAFAESLTDALASAYQNNPTLNVARARTRATDENIPIARSPILPDVRAGASVESAFTRNRFRTRCPAPGPPGTTTNCYSTRSFGDTDGTLDVVVTQNLFRGFRTRNALREAEVSVLASREDLRNTVQDVLFAAAEAYMNVLRDQALLGVYGVDF